MPPVEVDETELAAKNRVVGFVNQALANPKTRSRVLEIQKELNPDFTAPELETKNYVDAQMGEVKTLLTTFIDEQKKQREEETNARAQAELTMKWQTGRDKVLQTPGATNEYLGKLEEFMEKNGLIDHGIAMAAFERENPRPQPIATGDNRWGFFDTQTTESPDLKDLFEGRDETFLAKQVAATLTDVRGQRR